MEIVLSKSNPIVNATQNQLQQLLIQLIENAEEAISENRRGKIKIMISTHVADDARVAAISISDTGIGISEENIKKIFRPFYSTKGKQATGLGMMIVSAILENLGGTIGVKSLPAVGTTFKITLPLCET
jgi:two-component system NtrC family sensor kinase